ncbi:hypothetical protein lacNasYZ03_00720 [Lactobacillus nasalidis]|uniref:Uncharacterized protein n=1 Tax=Lactobacillus nasalidis TaxID=2797258 RepID=A0ABQ3W4T7_9LACO|nr:hypothetical protein [Lactobacillus nasalidis]GHV98314.1 hypothetical protein lacNasYZ01_14960 [Lactobacillus nasalidis]GHV98678.1 hypothetical protein lacNasYZ02_01080 [Lactobacillus nasalidis]GHW00385.1 hypothetical protein lacNasYZ03_00720 [Lactobacillus nasalidis]
MIYNLYLTQEGRTGQIPITDEQGKPFGAIRGKLDNPNHTLYLMDTCGSEIGRLFSDGTGLIASYTLDVVHHSLVHVKKVNSHQMNLFYITRLNYWVNGSIKQGSYAFRSGFKKVASVKTVVDDKGVTLTCQISREEDTPFILLIAVLFTQWHVTPLDLPDFLPIISRRTTSTANFFKLFSPYGRKHGRQ